MPISIDIPGCKQPVIFAAAFDRLRQIDKKFSTYKSGSEVSRYARGELAAAELSEGLSDVINACKQAEAETQGYFSAWPAGQFDPSGYVKGWAIAEAGKVIEARGFATYCIGAGGDILARSNCEKIWNIGIQDPLDKAKIVNKLSISNGAVCTSGNYVRGTHIINPKTGQPADYWASVTIIGPDIVTADILATAYFAAGAEGRDLIKSKNDYEVMTIAADGRTVATKNMHSMLS